VPPVLLVELAAAEPFGFGHLLFVMCYVQKQSSTIVSTGIVQHHSKQRLHRLQLLYQLQSAELVTRVELLKVSGLRRQRKRTAKYSIYLMHHVYERAVADFS
jgi:hypothetical protein